MPRFRGQPRGRRRSRDGGTFPSGGLGHSQSPGRGGGGGRFPATISRGLSEKHGGNQATGITPQWQPGEAHRPEETRKGMRDATAPGSPQLQSRMPRGKKQAEGSLRSAGGKYENEFTAKGESRPATEAGRIVGGGVARSRSVRCQGGNTTRRMPRMRHVGRQRFIRGRPAVQGRGFEGQPSRTRATKESAPGAANSGGTGQQPAKQRANPAQGAGPTHETQAEGPWPIRPNAPLGRGSFLGAWQFGDRTHGATKGGVYGHTKRGQNPSPLRRSIPPQERHGCGSRERRGTRNFRERWDAVPPELRTRTGVARPP